MIIFKTKKDVFSHIMEEFIFSVFISHKKFVYLLFTEGSVKKKKKKRRISFGKDYELRIDFIF